MKRGRDKFKKFKPILKWFVIVISFFPYRLRVKLFNFSRFIQGTKGLAIRYILLKTLAKECGDNVSIHPNVYLFQVQNLSLGHNVSIHPMCYVDATGGVSIGNDVSIAHGASIMSTTHLYGDRFIPIKDQQIAYYFTRIEDNVWIGAKATILAGMNIASGSVIAANAVVTKDVSKDIIVGGIPAIKIKKRT
ncbi:acyltransferase [Cytobacillus kochii]|uniref:acyltransferase n=1 Tax=Cytobacillus kochii TaxID=859143 RepID=UPI00402A800D